MWKEKHFTLAAIVTLPLLSATYSGVTYWEDLTPNSDLVSLLDSLWFLFLVLWVVADSHSRTEIYRPYDYGFLVYIYSIAYLPYYFIKTRRWKGVFLLVLLVSLYELPWLTEWAIYYAS